MATAARRSAPLCTSSHAQSHPASAASPAHIPATTRAGNAPRNHGECPPRGVSTWAMADDSANEWTPRKPHSRLRGHEKPSDAIRCDDAKGCGFGSQALEIFVANRQHSTRDTNQDFVPANVSPQTDAHQPLSGHENPQPPVGSWAKPGHPCDAACRARKFHCRNQHRDAERAMNPKRCCHSGLDAS